MKEGTKNFLKEVIFTTAVSFFLISFLYLGVFAIPGEGGQKHTLLQFFRYLFVKLFCGVFPFSLSLGFINRIFCLKKSRALLRLYHFILTFLAYLVFIVLVFNVYNISYGFSGEGMETRTVINHILPFFPLYPLAIWMRKLGKVIFRVKDDTPYKSILD